MPPDLLPPDSLPPDWLLPDWPPSDQSLPDQPPPSTPPILFDHGHHVYLPTRSIMASLDLRLHVHLPTHSITASKCISEFTRSLGLQVHLQTRSIQVSNCISEFIRSQSPGAAPSTLDRGLQVYLQGATVRTPRYRGNGGGQSDGEYSADPGVHRHPLISISTYHSMKIPTLSFPTFGLTCYVWDFVDPCNCVDPQHRVVSYLLTRFLGSSNQNLNLSWISFGCSMGVSRCSSDYAPVPCAARLTVCLYIERLK